MRYSITLCLVAVALLSGCANQGTRAKEISIQYGVVTELTRVPVPSAVPAGAIVGGFTGLMLSRNSSAGRQIAAGAGGAALGGLITHALEGERRAYQYTIKFKDGATSRYITENGFLRPDDCVAIERGSYANLRRVSNALCEGTKPVVAEPTTVVEAAQCHEAKEQLLQASDDKEIEQSSRKVRILCQF